MKLSVLIPCHNEVKEVQKAYNSITSVIQKLPYDYEIIFEEDGSTDGTGDAIMRLSKKDAHVKALSFPDSRRGKGWGFKKMVSTATGDILITTDADLSVPAEAIPQLLAVMGKADMVLTDRYSHPDTRVPMRRFLPSRAYNLLIRLLFSIKANDTQSGMKLFRRQVLGRVSIETDGFDYDIELLAKAYAYGFKSVEMPVSYIYRKEARFSVLYHGPRTLLNTIRLRKRMKL